LEDLRTDHLNDNLKGRSVRGGVLIASSQTAQFVLGTIFTIVLARLLTPADFGLVAMVTAVTGLAQVFADLGLSEATIQRPEITPEQVNALFWINSAVGLGLTLLTAALAPVLAWFYREPRLIPITLVLAPTFLIGGLRVQPEALLKRQMRFKALAVRDVTSFFLGVLVAIVMGIEGAGYWAIVAFPLTANLLQMFSSWLLISWKPSRPRGAADVGSLVKFGGQVAASYLVSALSGNASNILIGWYWGAAPLGLYSRAGNLLMKPVSQLLVPAGGVAVPALSRIHGDPRRFARYYLSALNLIMWISAPLFGFLFVTAKPTIVILLGHKWLGAAPIFQLLCISALAQPFFQSTNWVLISSGRTDRFLRITIIATAIGLGALAFALPFGINAVALWCSVAQVAILPWVMSFCFRGTYLTLRTLGRAVLFPISSSLVGVLCAEAAALFVNPANDVTALFVTAVVFAAVYFLAVSLCRPVRKEITELKLLMHNLRPSRQTAADFAPKTIVSRIAQELRSDLFRWAAQNRSSQNHTHI
jgi:O-antigen/teichoic acid export membrane protein